MPEPDMYNVLHRPFLQTCYAKRWATKAFALSVIAPLVYGLALLSSEQLAAWGVYILDVVIICMLTRVLVRTWKVRNMVSGKGTIRSLKRSAHGVAMWVVVSEFVALCCLVDTGCVFFLSAATQRSPASIALTYAFVGFVAAAAVMAYFTNGLACEIELTAVNNSGRWYGWHGRTVRPW